MQFILESEHMELLTRVCRVLIVLKIEVYRDLLEWRYKVQLSRGRTNDGICMDNKMVAGYCFGIYMYLVLIPV